jgi:hypothetical protein
MALRIRIPEMGGYGGSAPTWTTEYCDGLMNQAFMRVSTSVAG